ncbi:beta-ketoacyl synthase N-terminal-like domain-containing protein [Streptomyces chartreusis]
MNFEAIAIVGRGCVLPDAFDPQVFWRNVVEGKQSLSRAPAGRWGLSVESVLAAGADLGTSGGAEAGGQRMQFGYLHNGRSVPLHVPAAEAPADRVWNDIGGYVRGFDESFDPEGFRLASSDILSLDPLVRWVLHAARDALREAGGTTNTDRTGLVMGNLSFPSAGLARFAESVWLDGAPDSLRRLLPAHATRRPDARNRFSSGLPAHLAAQALGLGAGAFALDAACASSLYAVKLACDRLHDRSADMMLAGAVNCPDDLFIRMGFCALSAMSRTGRSRPFHRDADGLVPAEGAGFVALMRLEDALAANSRILGVIRGVGLSNDGRTSGMLVPSQSRQERAMESAYACAGVAPESVTLIECHATGTAVGDATEATSMARVFRDAVGLPIGSAKSNFGHLITSAGIAGLLKVLGAMEAGIRPATLEAEEPIAELAGTQLRLLQANEEWPGLRRAAVSAFGFGGNNAHLVVDAWPEPTSAAPTTPLVAAHGGKPGPAREEDTLSRADGHPEEQLPIAVVALAVRTGTDRDTDDFRRSLFGDGPVQTTASTVNVQLNGLRFPPVDLGSALPQQLLLLETAREATAGLALPRERTGVFVGMGCDAEVARYGARWRAGSWIADSGSGEEDKSRLADAFQNALTSTGVLGTMPNLVANRLNTQLDLGGMGFTVSAEEASGTTSLKLAARALRSEELDAALVGAVDLSDEPVHRAALASLGQHQVPGDAAVALVLKRLSDARRDADPVLAILDDSADPAGLVVGDVSGIRDAADLVDPAARFGSAHAARGLLAVATAVLALNHRAIPRPGAPADPTLGALTARAVVTPLEAPATDVRLRSADTAPWLDAAHPRPRVFSGADAPAIADAVAAGRESTAGPARMVILSDDAGFAARAEAARRWLTVGGPQPDGVFFRTTPLAGEVAFVFSGGSMAYAGMGRELLLAFPDELARIEDRSGDLRSIAGWAYNGREPGRQHVLEQIWGASLLGQMHAEITRGRLGITPHAVLGYSSGESNALSAMGLWTDASDLVHDARASDLFTSKLVGDLSVVRRAWHAAGIDGKHWASHMVSAPVDEVRAALAPEAAAHMVTVNSPDSCVIGGEEESCRRVLERLAPAPSLPVPYDIAVHVPELAEIRQQWWKLHHRPVTPLPGVRFYTSSTCDWYYPDTESAADALTGMALSTVDFVRLVEKAWADGVRIFIEHGPRGLCASWIQQILGEREHLALSLDPSDGKDVQRLVRVVAELLCAGVEMDTDRLFSHLKAVVPQPGTNGPTISLSAHAPAPVLPELESDAEVMAHAPWLPPVTGQTAAPAPPQAPIAETLQIPMPRSAPLIHTARPAPAAVAPAPVVAELRPLPPAAPLPPVLVQAARTAPVLPPVLVAESRPIAASSALQAAAAAHAACYAQATEAHRELLQSHSQAHQHFLRIRQETRRLLLHARTEQPFARSGPALPGSSVPALPPAPTIVTPPPAPPVSAPAEAVRPTRPPELAAPGPDRPGPSFDRSQLEHLASGRISDLFGAGFAAQDEYSLQTRMPRPPMLLADRVTGIDAVPASMGTGTIWTETDVAADSWYLDATGRMPAGIMIESGQADLLLISWLGVDLLNRGERVYRLLGCELTYHGSLPTPGETLSYEIHIDGHGEHNGVRIFFFHYDCYVNGELRLSVREGQAGFFTDAELAATRGVLWEPAEERPPAAAIAQPAIISTRTSFDRAQVRALAEGRPYDCFGEGWEATRAHVRSPQLGQGRMLFLDKVLSFDPVGGPWGRGYLRAQAPVSPDDWYFDGHFHNDPCMPGTLMFEGCLQTMAFYLAAMGFTAERDGWRFEPLPGKAYPMRCRGQVTPESRNLVYEVFVTEVCAGPEPTLIADVLCTVDGVKAFHARGLGLRLVPDWPLAHWKQLSAHAEQTTGAPVPLPELGGLRGHIEPAPVATVDGFSFDWPSLLACAWGRPSEAFGAMYAAFDGHRKVARLPGPPYHFMSRVSAVHGPPGGMQTGSWVEAEYDTPDEVWYREQNASTSMPLAVLMEVALQPCGWLASYVGSALTTETDLLFRNLDGEGTVHAEVPPGTRTIRTRAEITRIARIAGMIIENFEVECTADGVRVFTASTVFGYFPKEAFDDQVGLPPTDAERALRDEPGPGSIDLTTRPARYCEGSLRLAGPMLLMIDRVSGYWPEGGKAGLGRLRSEKDVDPGEWFFKAHFFQDPVQPGSLGVEAMAQLLQYYMIERGMGEGMRSPRFEPVMTGSTLTWKYRGQVVPTNHKIIVEMDIVEVGRDQKGPFAVADAWLWADDKRIYRADRLMMRIVEDEGGSHKAVTGDALPAASPTRVLDPATDGWLLDHRPTWSVPTLPMMSTVDLLAEAAARYTGQPVGGLRDVRLHRWVPLTGPVTVSCEIQPSEPGSDEVEATLLVWREARTAALSRFEPVAHGIVRTGAPVLGPPPAASPLADSVPVPDPYTEGALFHGPAFRYLTSLRIGATGSSATLDAMGGDVPPGELHQGLLDAATHAVPHDRLWQWSAEIPEATVGYPHRLAFLDLFEPLPRAGKVTVEARFAGFDGENRSLPMIDIQLLHHGRTIAALRLVDVLLPQGPLGSASRAQRLAFLKDRRYADGVGLSTTTLDGTTRLTGEDVQRCDWLQGTVAHAYGLPPGVKGVDHLAAIAVRDHVARLCAVHPTQVAIGEDLTTAHPADRPQDVHHLVVERSDDAVAVRSRSSA